MMTILHDSRREEAGTPEIEPKAMNSAVKKASGIAKGIVNYESAFSFSFSDPEIPLVWLCIKYRRKLVSESRNPRFSNATMLYCELSICVTWIRMSHVLVGTSYLVTSPPLISVQ